MRHTARGRALLLATAAALLLLAPWPALAQLCATNADCDDGLSCTGQETCVLLACVAGIPDLCDDGVLCTLDLCDLNSDSCTHTPLDLLCSDGTYCNGAEVCDLLQGCIDQADPDCDDGVGCSTDTCNELLDTCDHDADDSACDDGQHCNGVETCDVTNDCQNGSAPDCDDGVGCTNDSCNEGNDSCDHSPDDSTCDDGLYCNGAETCDVLNDCQNGSAPGCDDGVGCTTDSCNEGSDSCDHSADDSTCDDGLYCNGAETCDVVSDCQNGSAPGCDDGVGCTTDSCNEGSDSCDHSPGDASCDDGLYCNGAETCDVVNDCQNGSAPGCDDGVGCTTDSCNEGSDSCDHSPVDASCDDGLFCNGTETCDETNGCEGSPVSACDDGVACTIDACDEGADSCDHSPDDGGCDDGVFCNGAETCDVTNGCESAPASACDDGIACTTDSCDEGADSCDHSPDDADCDDGVFCNGAETCDVANGCENAPLSACDDGVACTTDSCDEGADSCDHSPDDADCDDGLFCNGAETCDATNGCENAPAAACDDGIACTNDACTEGADSCDHSPVDASCDDGVFCNGAETCDVTNGCESASVSACDDGVACTSDSCNEGADSCDHSPVDATCDDGLFCNGAETCDVTNGCQAGVAPSCGDGVGCTIDGCNETSDSCTHDANDGACDDGLFCNGTETCDVTNDCQAGETVECPDLGSPCADNECSEDEQACAAVPINNGQACSEGTTCTPDGVCANGVCQGRSLCPSPCQECQEGACVDMCGVPFTKKDKPTTTDGLFILRSAVGLNFCAKCVCDVNNTDTITALDGLYVVRKAVGLPTPLTCPIPPSTTTTTITTTTTVAPDSTTTTTLL